MLLATQQRTAVADGCCLHFARQVGRAGIKQRLGRPFRCCYGRAFVHYMLCARGRDGFTLPPAAAQPPSACASGLASRPVALGPLPVPAATPAAPPPLPGPTPVGSASPPVTAAVPGPAARPLPAPAAPAAPLPAAAQPPAPALAPPLPPRGAPAAAAAPGRALPAVSALLTAAAATAASRRAVPPFASAVAHRQARGQPRLQLVKGPASKPPGLALSPWADSAASPTRALNAHVMTFT